MPLIDLHAHTNLSDGTSSPAEVVRAYLRAGVQLMAISDHDCLEGVPAAAQAAKKYNLPFISAVEISAREDDHLHILGYGVDLENKKLADFLAQNRQNRFTRIKKIVAQLKEAGLPLEEEDVFRLVKTAPSRAHVADAIKNKGFSSSRQESFRKYLCQGKAGYVPPQGPCASEVIKAIRQAGGKAFLAHPGIIKDIWDFPAWVNCGLEGLEVYYPSHSLEIKKDLLAIAEKYNLIVSGGSDHHGPKSGRDNSIGLEVPQKVFDKLKEVFIGD